jgi:hypothetical protein
MSSLVKLTEIKEIVQRWPSNTRKYELSEVVVNSQVIETLRDGSHFKKEIKSYKGWPAGLDERIFITEILLSEQSIYVVGDLENITKKFGGYRG